MNAKNLAAVTIEVETSTLEEVREIKQLIQNFGRGCHVTRVMLDNMTSWTNGKFDMHLLSEAVDVLKGDTVRLGA